MSILVWVMMGIAVWHFAVWVPDNFYGGIVGALLAAVIGAGLVGFFVAGLTIPSRDATHIDQALIAIPGSVAALIVSYVLGSSGGPAQKQERSRAQRGRPQARSPKRRR